MFLNVRWPVSAPTKDSRSDTTLLDEVVVVRLPFVVFLSSYSLRITQPLESSCFDGIRYGTRNLTKIYCTFDSV